MKRILYLSLSAVLIFALCLSLAACEEKDNNSVSLSQFAGKWESVGFEDFKMKDGADVKVTLTINNDSTFTLEQTASVDDFELEATVHGICVVSGGVLTCRVKDSSATYSGGEELVETIDSDLDLTLKGDQLTARLLPDDGVVTFIKK